MRPSRLFAKNLFWIVTLTVLFISAGVGALLGQKKISALPPIADNSYKCEQRLSENPQTFTVYVTDNWLADVLLSTLCNDAVMRRQFGDVHVTVGTNDFDTFEYINYGIADLALVKQHQINAFASEKVQGYQAIARYPDYSAYFIAKNERPTLSKEYLLGKRIGLLDYPSSRSGHIEPKIKLQSLEINESNADIRYYNSHQELRQKLLVDEVDIIASYWDPDDAGTLSENYIVQINANVSGSRWFLRQQNRNTDLICALQSSLEVISQDPPSNYYSHIQRLPLASVSCAND
ncbi:PhnD/SsuA/transferrin family substrate-binding protein [Alteromonas oceanisediminis]|uniref:PhnD/SsuA/transferrin family substrate-binding protein n=1 Tax=Alteromonas oceanisediminis TaxID=2836180 RepID=UPI001BD92832|nr:PhnD/SsuA/transferrin family substrate-binding protein [Alteromonas oceanisediminis]MBT0585920.1 hypothetical protein [Alteromonas oceanisediminis]